MWNDATQVGIVIVVLTVGGMLAGKFIDNAFHSAPFGILGGIFLGVISASIFLVYKFTAIIKKEELLYTKEKTQGKGGVSMDVCQKCGHEHEGTCDCGCDVTKCPSCGHMHEDACSCGCDK
jgi:Putative F0F1-ATPase subunit Ca2+/Mg2+ transporter